MPYVLTGMSKSSGFDVKQNERTRDWQTELTGWRRRAYWAHQNTFEALPAQVGLLLVALGVVG